MTVPGGAHRRPGGRWGGGGREKTAAAVGARARERRAGEARAVGAGAPPRVSLPIFYFKSTFLRNSGARRGRTTSHYFGTHVRLGRSNRHWRARRHWRGRRLLHMSTSAGLSGLPGKPGVSGTTSDAPEEATQRPPFLALRGPSHSHPGALLHRRRRITLWQTTSPATSGPFPWGGGWSDEGLAGRS